MLNTKKELVSGILYTALAKYSSIAVQLVVTAILARLLTPADYGVVAIATVFIVFFNMLSDIGIGPAIIQFKDLDRHDLNHIFSFTVYVGIILSILFFFASWSIAKYYDNKTLIPICQLLCLTILFYCINIVPQNIQFKKKRFRFIAVVILTSHILSATGAIALAFLKFGVYALAFQQIFSVIFIFIIFYLQDKLSFTIKIEKAPLMKILSFSMYQFLFNVVNYFSRNLDKLMIGRFIGFASLGQYDKSYRLMLMPLQNIAFAVTPVLQPIFSELQNNLYEMAENYKKLFQFLCYIGFPLSAFLFFTGKELILIFFGNQWYEAIFPFRVMALTVGLQILNGTTGSVYQSANATKQLFIAGCLTAFIMITGFAVSIFGWRTINAVAVGFAVAQFLNSIQVYYMLFRILHYPLNKILYCMLYPLLITLIIGIVLFLIDPWCNRIIIIGSLIVKSIISLIVWCVCVNYVGPYKGIIDTFLLKIIHRWRFKLSL